MKFAVTPLVLTPFVPFRTAQAFGAFRDRPDFLERAAAQAESCKWQRVECALALVAPEGRAMRARQASISAAPAERVRDTVRCWRPKKCAARVRVATALEASCAEHTPGL